MFKQTLAVALAFLGLNGGIWVETAAAQTPPPQTTACAAPKLAGTAVDLQQVPGSNLMTAPVEIDGTSRQFLLDIGTNPDEVSDPLRAALNLPQIDQSSASNAMANLNTPFQFGASFYDVKGANAPASYQTRVRVASFAFAGATVQNMQMPVANDRDMGKSEPYDGRLTGSLFAQYDMNFDFGGKKFSFADPTSCTDPNQVAYWPHTAVAVVPMTMSNGKMSVPVTINGHTINALIDTGLTQTVMRRDIAQNLFGLKTGAPDMTPDGDLEDGAGQQIYQHTFPQIAFEGVIANNVPVRIQANSMVHKLNRTPTLGSRAQFTADPADRIPDLALGMDVLRQLHLYAAFGQNKLYVTSAGTTADAPPPKL
jgi:hypothetical protein